jgi:hypothetical protein
MVNKKNYIKINHFKILIFSSPQLYYDLIYESDLF